MKLRWNFVIYTSLLDKSHQTLRLSLPSLDLRKARSQKKINNLSQDRHLSGYLTVEISIRPVSRKALLLKVRHYSS